VSGGVAGKARAAGGEIYAISSEPQALADRAATDWQLDFETVGDPHHEISSACRERGWIDLFVNERLDFLRASAGRPLDWVPTHPKGYFQPGVLALTGDGRVLHERSKPVTPSGMQISTPTRRSTHRAYRGRSSHRCSSRTAGS
jgi:hypothetical protein